ncbi:MAG: sensor histidine kinase [Solirubrobacteraceae bacterium]
MMRSLRARLIASVLAITTLGLILLAAITYAEQRSFLLDRVDQQLRNSPAAMTHVLADDGIGPSDDRGPDGRGSEHGINLPPGTYGQRRDSAGQVLGEVVVSYGDTITAKPQIPTDVPLGETMTVDGSNGAGYRLIAVADPLSSGTTIVAIPLSDTEETLYRLLVVEGLVLVGVLLALGLVAWIVVRVGLRPLDRIAGTAGLIAGGDLSHRITSTDQRTEVGRLGTALNSMLDRLEKAFAERQASEDRLRRFLADASHELRTPLASIRGYAELYRMGATREPDDLARSMDRIESETTRMGVLVEDLLTLARLDEVSGAPHVPVDVGDLARDTADDARAAAPDRRIEAVVNGDVLAVGDPNQLQQVLANLVRNALVHTPDGTPVEVTASRENGHVLVEVRDHGPGLPDADPSVLFERFWRAEGGRERGKDGAGLGLAIVAEIVQAHRGVVSARNAQGGGAIFRVALPASGEAQDVALRNSQPCPSQS